MKSVGKVLHGGAASGRLLKLVAPLSFWGGLDAASGLIIDRAHPQVGVSMEGRVVAMPGSRGSSGTPGVLGEAIRAGVGPAALVVTKPDINLAAGVIVAAALYGIRCPLVLVSIDVWRDLPDGVEATISPDGTISF